MYRLSRECLPCLTSRKYQPAQSQENDWQHLEIDPAHRITGIREMASKDIKLRSENHHEMHIGQGEFANVYEVIVKLADANQVNHKVKQKAALKKFRWHEDRFRKLAHEARTLHQLNHHQFIPQLYGICYRNEHFGLLLELCEGSSLGDLTRGYPSKMSIPLSILKDWASQISSGMEYLTGQGYLHNDLKADNVMIKEPICYCAISQVTALEWCSNCSKRPLNKLSLKLIGLGAASDMEKMNARTEKSPWSAPEEKSSEFSEVWSFGVLLWEITARRIPKSRDMLIEENWPKDWKHLMSECMSENLIDRPSFREICGYLKAMKNTSIEIQPLVTQRRVLFSDEYFELDMIESNSIKLPGKSKSLDDCFLRNGKFGNFYKILITNKKSYWRCKCLGENGAKGLEQKGALQKIMISERDYQYRNYVNYAQKIAQLSHENIIQLMSVSQEDRYFGLIFELCEGETLREHCQVKRDYDNAPYLKIVIGWAMQIASGMEYLNSRQLEDHCDLSAANILIKEQICYCPDSEKLEAIVCSTCSRRPLNKLTLKISEISMEPCHQTKQYGNLLWEVTNRKLPKDWDTIEVRKEWPPTWKDIVRKSWSGCGFSEILKELEEYSLQLDANADHWEVTTDIVYASVDDDKRP